MTAVQPIEGITPGALWTTAGVLLALAGIAIIVFKIVEFVQGQKDRKAQKEALGGKGLTDEIADKVMEALTPRLSKIEDKLSIDKQRLDSHELRLNEQEGTLRRISRDTEQIMDVLDGMLMYFISENDNDGLKEVKAGLDHYKNTRVRA